MHSGLPEHPTYPPALGATYLGDGKCRFLVWAPHVERVELKLVAPRPAVLPMQVRERGYFELTAEGIEPGARYFYRLAGERDRPDPASRFQPEGVHGPSAVVESPFRWTDAHWHGLPLHQYITYELHVGTFSEEGTFDAAIAHLDALRQLGITAVELMPVAQFPGGRNWGYDGVLPFAVQNTYGGPDGLRRFVDAAHQRELAVVMDVVYNHVGPEGNYLAEFGPYFTDRHHTPWGRAVNYDDHGSDEVRRFFIESALAWLEAFHIDALRLDAVHAIFDFSARPFLQELADAVRQEGERLNRRVYTIAESSLNDARLIASKELGGCGIDGQWCDDLHHAVRTTLVDERGGYYADFRGFDHLVKAYRDGFVHDGDYSEYRGRRHGNTVRHVDPIRLVVCSQNHDQVGNRLSGERLTDLVSFEQLKLAAGLILLSPYQPLLFMGEEYGETAPFQFFISHGDPQLVEAVRRGRKEEFARFRWQQEPPDPQAEETFMRCKLNHALRHAGQHRALWAFYQRLIELRKTASPLAFPDRQRMQIDVPAPERVLAVRSWSAECELALLFHVGAEAATVPFRWPVGTWNQLLDSADPAWAGPGSGLPPRLESSGDVSLVLPPCSVAVYRRNLR
jgi:maltooligosyltrehalose trehalohydrolase